MKKISFLALKTKICKDLKSRKKNIKFDSKQGRVHSYQSHMWVGRGSDEKGYPGIWAGAVVQKTPINAKKAKCYQPTIRPYKKQT